MIIVGYAYSYVYILISRIGFEFYISQSKSG